MAKGKRPPWAPDAFMLECTLARIPARVGYFGDLKRECRCGPLQVQRCIARRGDEICVWVRRLNSWLKDPDEFSQIILTASWPLCRREADYVTRTFQRILGRAESQPARPDLRLDTA